MFINISYTVIIFNSNNQIIKMAAWLEYRKCFNIMVCKFVLLLKHNGAIFIDFVTESIHQFECKKHSKNINL